MSISEVAVLWNEIEKLLGEFASTVLPTLNPPATHQDINLLETEIGLILPSDFRYSLQIHNGQHDLSRLELLSEHGILLSCDNIIKSWKMLCEILDSIDPIADESEWWNKKYLPIADYEGNFLCIDLTNEYYGKIHYHVHDSEVERNVANSYTDWLRNVRDIFKHRRFSDTNGYIDFWSFDT